MTLLRRRGTLRCVERSRKIKHERLKERKALAENVRRVARREASSCGDRGGAWQALTERWAESFPKLTTRKNAGVALRRFNAFLKIRGIPLAGENIEVTQENVRDYYTHLHEQYPKATAKQYIRRLRSMFAFLDKEGGLPNLHCEVKKDGVAVETTLSDDEMDRMWECADSQEKVILALLRHFGIGIREMVPLKGSSVTLLDQDTLQIELADGQCRKGRVYDNASGKANRYAACVYARRESALLIGTSISQRTLYRRLRRVAVAAGITRKIMPVHFLNVR